MTMYPLEPGDVEAAMSAAVSAAGQLQDHTQSLIAGLGSPGGDPLVAADDPESRPEVAGQVSET